MRQNDVFQPLVRAETEIKKCQQAHMLIDTLQQENGDSENGNLETVILFYIIRL